MGVSRPPWLGCGSLPASRLDNPPKTVAAANSHRRALIYHLSMYMIMQLYTNAVLQVMGRDCWL